VWIEEKVKKIEYKPKLRYKRVLMFHTKYVSHVDVWSIVDKKSEFIGGIIDKFELWYISGVSTPYAFEFGNDNRLVVERDNLLGYEIANSEVST